MQHTLRLGSTNWDVQLLLQLPPLPCCNGSRTATGGDSQVCGVGSGRSACSYAICSRREGRKRGEKAGLRLALPWPQVLRRNRLNCQDTAALQLPRAPRTSRRAAGKARERQLPHRPTARQQLTDPALLMLPATCDAEEAKKWRDRGRVRDLNFKQGAAQHGPAGR